MSGNYVIDTYSSFSFINTEDSGKILTFNPMTKTVCRIFIRINGVDKQAITYTEGFFTLATFTLPYEMSDNDVPSMKLYEDLKLDLNETSNLLDTYARNHQDLAELVGQQYVQIMELNTKISNLETENAALKKTIAAIEERLKALENVDLTTYALKSDIPEIVCSSTNPGNYTNTQLDDMVFSARRSLAMEIKLDLLDARL